MRALQLGRRLSRSISDRSILTKLIASLFIIVTPLYVFNYVITSIGAEKNRQEIERAVISSVESYDNLISGELQRIRQMMRTSAIDTAMLHLDLVKPDISYVEKTTFLSQIRPFLTRIFYSTRFLSEVSLQLPILGLSSSATAGSLPFDASAYDALKRETEPFVRWNGNLYMIVPYVPTIPEFDGMFVLTAQISEATLSSYLSKIIAFDRSGALMFDRNDKWSLSSRPPDAVSEEIKRRLLALNASTTFDSGAVVVTENIGGERYLIAYEPSTGSDGILAAYAPESELFDSLSIYKKFFYSFSLLSVLVIVLFSLGLYKLIHKPLRTLVQAFRKVELGQLQFSLRHRHGDEFGYLYHRFNNMTETLDNMVNVVYEQKLLNERSELKRLQSQINPHFLYNNFFILQRLIRLGNKDKATEFAEYLGRYFQFVTRNASDEITLEEDVRHAQTYVDIQSVCFDRRVVVTFGPLPDEIKHQLVPRLIVQPVLENCFNHVFEKQLSQGELSVSFAIDERYVHIDVEDNGKQLDDRQLDELTTRLSLAVKSTEESTGMINVHRRLRLMFGERSGLVLSRSALGGLHTRIVIERKGVDTHVEAIDR